MTKGQATTCLNDLITENNRTAGQGSAQSYKAITQKPKKRAQNQKKILTKA
jgi:hypothetical protein